VDVSSYVDRGIVLILHGNPPGPHDLALQAQQVKRSARHVIAPIEH